MSTHATNEARVIPLRPHASPPGSGGAVRAPQEAAGAPRTPASREPLWRDVVGDVLRRERLAQERTLKDVAEAARISMPYLSELERGRKEASSEVLAAAARALGLGLSDLLSLAQDELSRYAAIRHTASRVGGSRTGRGRVSPTARYDGLCLAS
ncbi:helix-turn-helix domain-containing protein [Kitasatospora sp. NPDC090091]|uniref:helix-turn-helix domain-containing protein n=1 Tax=Kitasatospora sp. NPDC090091 TaxID=3364081 RepID=UPI0038263604